MSQPMAVSLAQVNKLNSLAHESKLAAQEICLPVSMVFALKESSQGRLLNSLNEGFAQFTETLKSQAITSSLELALIQTSDYARVSHPLKKVSEMRTTPILSAYGSELAVAQGVEIAFTMLVSRYQYLKEQHKAVKRPWLILFTDGMGTDYHLETAQKLRAYSEDKRLIIFIVNVGEADDSLATFSTIAPLEITENQIDNMFNWFSNSFLKILNSKEGEVSLSEPRL